VLVAMMAATLVVAAPAEAAKKKPPKPLKVQLLGINDFHGHLEATPPAFVSRTGDPELRVPAGGVEYLATHIRMLKRRHPNTLVVGAGDLVGASPLLSSLFHDEPTIEAMNAIGLDVTAVGNHEFDEGAAELRRLKRGGCHPVDGCRDGTPYAGARFRYLAANVERRSTGNPIFPPYWIKRVKGVPIGFIGMTLKGTPQLLPPQFAAPLRFRDEATTANRIAKRLKRRGVRAIVVLLHEGGFPVEKEAGVDACPGISGPIRSIVRHITHDVDLFLTAHTHKIYNCVIDGRHVTSAGSYGRLITRVELQINRRTHEISKVATDNYVVGQDVPKAPAMTALIAHYDHFAAPIAGRVIGRLSRGAGRRRDSSGESRMGSLVADAQADSTDADAAFVNPTSLRTGLPTGEITYGRAFTSLPFGNSLVTMSMTGGQILELLKQQWCGRATAEILHVSSSVSYTWSRAKARAATNKPCEQAPQPVSGLKIGDLVVEPFYNFRVTVNTSMSGRDAQFSILHTGTDRTGGPVDIDSLDQHLAPSVSGAPVVVPKLDRIDVMP
jgi:5'-nucleotidase